MKILKRKLRALLIAAAVIQSFSGCSTTTNPLAYQYTGSDLSYSIVESKFERISMRNWTKFDLYMVDGKFTEVDNFYGNTIPTKLSVGEHEIQIKVETMIAEGLVPRVITAKVNLKFDFKPIKYKINGSTSEQKLWIETEHGLMVTPKMDINYLK